MFYYICLIFIMHFNNRDKIASFNSARLTLLRLLFNSMNLYEFNYEQKRLFLPPFSPTNNHNSPYLISEHYVFFDVYSFFDVYKPLILLDLYGCFFKTWF